MTQDPKNLILAIGLSLLVIIGWQYFYAGPQLEKQRQAQAQLQQPATAAANRRDDADPERRGTRSRARRSAAAQRGNTADLAGGGADARAGACREPAHRNRHEEPVRLDRAEGRPDRRCRAEGLSRDRRSRRARISCCCRPRARREPYYAEWGFVPQPGQNIALPKSDTVWTADRRPADAPTSRSISPTTTARA